MRGFAFGELGRPFQPLSEKELARTYASTTLACVRSSVGTRSPSARNMPPSLKQAWVSYLAKRTALDADIEAIRRRQVSYLAQRAALDADFEPLQRRLDNLTLMLRPVGGKDKRHVADFRPHQLNTGRILYIVLLSLQQSTVNLFASHHWGYTQFAIAAHYGLPLATTSELGAAIRADFGLAKLMEPNDARRGGGGSDSLCPPYPAPLRFVGNSRGLGNRIGWALTAAAVAEAANAPALLTYWPGADRRINGDVYDYREVARLVHFPRRMRFVEERVLRVLGNVRGHDPSPRALSELELETLSQAAFEYAVPNRTYEVPPPWRSHPYINEYIMEAAWPMVEHYGSPFHTQLPSHRHNFTMPKCLDRANFERAYRTVQAELSPRAALQACLPPPRSFLVLHVRGKHR